MSDHNPLNSKDTLQTKGGDVTIYRLDRLDVDTTRLPMSIKVLLEAALRNLDGYQVNEEDVTGLAGWNAKSPAQVELPFKPARVVLQDFTGVPALVDLAALSSAMDRLGGEPPRGTLLRDDRVGAAQQRDRSLPRREERLRRRRRQHRAHYI